MNWSETIDSITLYDAYMTYKKMFYSKFNTKLSLTKFLRNTLFSRQYENMNITQIKKLTLKNFNKLRLNKSPELAYPLNDRPRGIKDIKSMQYHLSTKKCISPIVILQYKKKYILLDGTHRLVAASLRKSMIRCCFIIL